MVTGFWIRVRSRGFAGGNGYGCADGGRYKEAGGRGDGFGKLDITAFSVIDSWLFRLQCILS